MLHFLEQLGLTQKIMIDVLVALVTLLVSVFTIRILKRMVVRRLNTWSKGRTSLDPELMSGALKSSYWFAILLTLQISYHLAPIGKTALKYGDYIFTVLYALLAISLFSSILRFVLDLMLRHRGSSLMEYKGRVLLPVISGFTWIIALAFILENMGVEISTILAGFGVAGVAVGFAAQAVLGDLFSYFAILFDHPFRIGDFIVISPEIRGNIEHIGLKTSRIRSLDGEQIILSNSDLTNSRVKNYRRMHQRRVLFQFGVLYSTPPDKLEALPEIIRKIVDETPRATFDRAHFQGFGDSSLNFEVVYFVESPDYNVYMDTQQTINLGLVRAIEQQGMGFAFPTRTVHIERQSETACSNS